MNISVLRKAGEFVTEHSPEILTGIAVLGVGVTIISTVKAVPMAEDLKADAEIKKSDELGSKELVELDMFESIKAQAKAYIPTAIAATATIACIIGSNRVNHARNAALAGAYVISERALANYKDSVSKIVGHDGLKMIKDAAAEKTVNENPKTEDNTAKQSSPADRQFAFGNTEEYWIYDSPSGRYFKASPEFIKQVENQANKLLLGSNWISMNDLYEMLGLEPTSIGDDLGWDVNGNGLIDFHFGSTITPKDEPCLVLTYEVAPRYRHYY